MVTYRDRFSRKNLIAIFVACAFPIHVWAIIGLLNQVPAWILRVNLWELAGMISLTLVFALLESLVITAGVILIAALIPGKWFTERIAVYCTIFVWLTAIVSIIFHFREPLMRSLVGILVAVVYLALILGSYWYLRRFPKIETGIVKVLGSLTVLTAVYVAVDLAGFVIVLIRNL